MRDAQRLLAALEGGRAKTVTSDLIIERDLKSGLFGMSLGVGYPASIVAQMLARREITEPGLLNPLQHVPDGRFLDELAKRGIQVAETVAWELRRKIFGRRPRSANDAAAQKAAQQGGN